MHFPKISVVTPSLNQGKCVERCIQSVLHQAYPNFEHIIIDGGSSDETLEILRQYSHLKWVSESDHGQAQAINKGMRIANGEILAWLNSDDEYTDGAFVAVADAVEKTLGQTVILGGVELFYKGKPLRLMTNRAQTFFRFLQPWIPYTNISQPGIFIPAKILKEGILLDEEVYYGMDFDLICRFLKEKTPFYNMHKVVARYNIHPACKTGQGWSQMYPELDRISLKHASSLNRFKRFLFLVSFKFLRPGIRFLYRKFLPPIY